MRDDWKVVPFGEVCEISGGSQPPKSNFIYEPKDGYIRLVQVRDYRTDKYMTYVPIEKAKKFCTKSDIMIGRYGPPIFGIFRGIEGAYNVALMKAIPNEEKLDKEFLRWFLKTHTLVRFIEKTSKRAAGQDGVRKERLYAYPTPVPSLEEQKKIVAILDQVFTAIDQAKVNIEKNIVNAKELFQSKREDFFIKAYEISGNKFDILKNVCTIKTGKLNSNAMVENGKYPFFTCSREIFSIDKYAFDTEAVLLAGNNASGDFNVKYYKGKFNAYQRTYVITINNADLSYSFLKHKLEHNLQAFKRQSVGAATRFLKIGMINNLEIPIPNIKVQKDLCGNLDLLKDNLDTLISSYIKKHESLEELKKSLLQKAFAGELTQKEVTV
jgi:type I restriction enzyme S subunit